MNFSWFVGIFIKRNWKYLHELYGLGPHKYKVGDLVTRHGSGIHRIVDIDYGWLQLTVECLCICNRGCCIVGEKEYNLIRRYELVTENTLFNPYTREEVDAYLNGTGVL